MKFQLGINLNKIKRRENRKIYIAINSKANKVLFKPAEELKAFEVWITLNKMLSVQ